MKYRLLGQFAYCGQTLSLTSAEDETHFRVTSEGARNTPFDKSFPDFSRAKAAFELAVYEIITYCSTSDLTLYMQWNAPVLDA